MRCVIIKKNEKRIYGFLSAFTAQTTLQRGQLYTMNLFYFLTPKAEVAYLYHDFTLRQALEKMEYHRYSSIPILNRAGEYVGTVTEGDLLWFIKNSAGLDLSSAEDTPLMSIPRKHDYACVSIDTDIDHLINAAMRQNFVPVIDGKNSFIGIVKRNALIQYCYERYRQTPSIPSGKNLCARSDKNCLTNV